MESLYAFQRDILYVVAGSGGLNGLEIKRELEAYHNSEINDGQLYPNLNTLVDDGLLKQRHQDGRTHCYRLAERAKDYIEQRREWKENYYSLSPE